METAINISSNTEKINNTACGCGSGGCGCHSGAPELLETDAGVPARFQVIQQGDRIVEFGSGTGNDAIIMARLTGVSGKVTGIDHAPENIRAAQHLLDQSGINNVEFRIGNIEDAPVADETADIIYATCVFNLQQNKQRVADEMYRIVKHNGVVCVSDFVILEEIPDGLRKEASAFAGCIAGAEKVDIFMNYFRKTGFSEGGIVEVNKVRLPDEMLGKHLSPEEIDAYNDLDSDKGIFSVVLVVEKPETCTPETCCHNPDKHKNN